MGKNQRKRIVVTKKYKAHQESMTPTKSPDVQTIRDMPPASAKQGSRKSIH
jgi:ribosomal protein S17